jgi:hypothetical protein
LTIEEVEGYALVDLDNLGDLASVLGIYKYQEPEPNSSSPKGRKAAKSFPSFLYRTDEPRIENCNWHFPLQLIGSEKLDGSSITLFFRQGEFGICSRNVNLSLTEEKVIDRKNDWWSRILAFFGKDINIYDTFPSENPFVVVGLPYLNKLVEYCTKQGIDMALRGELVGYGASAGSGNKNNPHSQVEPTIYFYGADFFYNGVAQKMPHLEYIGNIVGFGFEHPRIVFNQSFDSLEDLKKACNNYFSNNVIEGIVVRDPLSKLSAKVMNNEYDSKK